MKKKTVQKKKVNALSDTNELTISGQSVDIVDAIKTYKVSGKSSAFTQRQRAIFEEKFGIKDGVRKTNAEVARKFGISPTRVLQLYANVLYKMGYLS